MTDKVKQELKDMGFDLDDALKRFVNNEALYEKFLVKFSSDPNYSLLVDSVKNCNKEEAFKAAHTLKGVCGNLSINRLLELVSKQVEYFRADKWDEGVAMMDTITDEYNKTVKAINNLPG